MAIFDCRLVGCQTIWRSTLSLRYRTASGSDRPGYAVVPTACVRYHAKPRAVGDDCVPGPVATASRFCNEGVMSKPGTRIDSRSRKGLVFEQRDEGLNHGYL